MSDLESRVSARKAFADPGDLDAGVRWLRGRLRVGELTRGRVGIAAYCGDELSLVLDGGPYTDHCYGCERSGVRYEGRGESTGAARCARCLTLSVWLRGLECRGRDILVRAAVLAARTALRTLREPCWSCRGSGLAEDEHGRCLGLCPFCDDDPSGGPTLAIPMNCPEEEAIEAAEAWLKCPCEHHTAEAAVLAWSLHNQNPRLIWAYGAGAHVGENLPRVHPWATFGIMSAAYLVGEQSIREAVQKGLIDWALGYSDAV